MVLDAFVVGVEDHVDVGRLREGMAVAGAVPSLVDVCAEEDTGPGTVLDGHAEVLDGGALLVQLGTEAVDVVVVGRGSEDIGEPQKHIGDIAHA